MEAHSEPGGRSRELINAFTQDTDQIPVPIPENNSEPTAQGSADPVALRFIGERGPHARQPQAWLPGVPARDLTEADIDEVSAREPINEPMIIASGLYERVRNTLTRAPALEIRWDYRGGVYRFDFGHRIGVYNSGSAPAPLVRVQLASITPDNRVPPGALPRFLRWMEREIEATIPPGIERHAEVLQYRRTATQTPGHIVSFATEESFEFEPDVNLEYQLRIRAFALDGSSCERIFTIRSEYGSVPEGGGPISFGFHPLV